MNTKTIIIFLVAIAVLIGLFVFLKPNSLNQYEDISREKVFSLIVQNNKIVSGVTTLEVGEGESVVIKIKTDADEEFHLHGYDRSVDLKKDVESMISFVANLTGRFEFELEESKTALGVLEVLPK